MGDLLDHAKRELRALPGARSEETGCVCPWVESGQYERDCLMANDDDEDDE